MSLHSVFKKILAALLVVGAWSVANAQYTVDQFQPIATRNGGAVDFKTAFSPASNIESEPGVVIINYRWGGSSSRYKFFIPPGLKDGLASMTTYKVDYDNGRGIWSFGKPPTVTAESVTEAMAWNLANGGPYSKGDFARTFHNLLSLPDNGNAGQQYFWAPANAGAVSLAYGEYEKLDVNQTKSKCGWVYADTVWPAGLVQQTAVWLYVDKATYDAWYASAQWDSLGNPVGNDCGGTSLVLTSSELSVGQTSAISASMSPSSVALPQTCTFLNTANGTDASGYISFTPGTTAHRVALSSAAATLSSNATVKMTCGSYFANFTIKVGSPYVSLSANSLMQGQTATLTLSPPPSGAVSCTANSNLVTLTDLTLSTKQVSVPAAATVSAETVVTISCGTYGSASLTVKKGGTLTLVSNASSPAVLTFAWNGVELKPFSNALLTAFSGQWTGATPLQCTPTETVLVENSNTLRMRDSAARPSTPVSVSCFVSADSTSGGVKVSPVYALQFNVAADGSLSVANVVALTDFSMTTDSVVVSTIAAGSGKTVTLSALPTAASLGSCSVSDSSLATVAGATVSLTAAGNALTTNAQISISCGSVAKPLQILGKSVAAITPSSAADAVPLTFSITIPKSGTDTGALNVWVAYYVPGNANVAFDDVWLLITDSTVNPAKFESYTYGKTLDSLRLVKAVAVTADKYAFDVQSGITKSQFSGYAAEVRVFYQYGAGALQLLPVSWKSVP